MKRRRSRRRGSSVTLPVLVLFASGVLLVAFVLGGGGMGAASFTAADASRNSAVNVASDDQGALTLDVAPAVHTNSTDSLVNVTNHLGQDVSVTVTLRDDSDHVGDLVVGESNVNNTTTFSLAAGETKTVKIEIPDDDSLTDETVYFAVDASGTGLEVTTADNSTPVNA